MRLPPIVKAHDYIYLDYNATAPMHPHVLQSMHDVAAFVGNPSALHQLGQQLKSIISSARNTIQEFIVGQHHHLFFTSGATESNAWILHSQPWDHIVFSAAEHPSILRNASKYTYCPITPEGILDLSALEQILHKNRYGSILLSIQIANSESGIQHPIRDIADIAKKYHAFLHTDATQAFGRIPLDFDALQVDAMTIAPHKAGGPKGIGALAIHHSHQLPPYIKGGGQEYGLRAGTENIQGIIGFATTCSIVPWDHMQKLRRWHTNLESALQILCPSAVLPFAQAPRLPNTSLIHMPHATTTQQTIHFDLKKIAVGAGSACSSGTLRGIHFLEALNYNQEIAQSTIRISSGWNSQEDDFLAFQSEWQNLYQIRNGS